MNKNKKRAIVFIIILSGLFLNYSFSLANGCCILDKSKTTADAANCQKNVTSCVGTNALFLDGDLSCNGPMAASFCGVSSNSDQLGCCITNSVDHSKFGPSNCAANKKKSECQGQIFNLTYPTCNNTEACKTPATIANAAATTGNASTSFANPIGFTSVSGVVGALINNLKGIIAWIAILFIVIGGMMYILSAGDEKMITKAKATITSAVIGLAIALAAPTFLKEIQNILGGGMGANADEMVNNALTIKDIVMRTLNLLLSVVGIVAIISLVIGGAFYLTAYGDEDRAKKGKTIITNSLIGIVVVMAALVIVSQISKLMMPSAISSQTINSAPVANPAQTINSAPDKNKITYSDGCGSIAGGALCGGAASDGSGYCMMINSSTCGSSHTISASGDGSRPDFGPPDRNNL